MLPQLSTLDCLLHFSVSDCRYRDITNIWESQALGESDVICVLKFFIWSIQSKTEGKAWKAKNLARTTLPLKSSHYRKKYFSYLTTRNSPSILSPLKAGQLFDGVVLCVEGTGRDILVLVVLGTLTVSHHIVCLLDDMQELGGEQWQPVTQPWEGCKLWWRGRRQI